MGVCLADKVIGEVLAAYEILYAARTVLHYKLWLHMLCV